MKKIMFNDRYGLTQAVTEGRKTMTRRLVPWALKPRDEKRYTRPVGERFVYEGENVEVVGYDPNKEGCACRDCARFGNCSYNEMTGSCRWYKREDEMDVIFRKVEQEVTV